MYTEGTLFDGRYLLKERKGRGSFGEVWLAEDTELGMDFAIKIYVAMDENGLEEFRKEYKVSCNLINSNLLHINRMEVSKENSCPYLVMPYCPRGASSLIGQMPEADMWHFIHDVANGLAYLHEQMPPIIHQDIKPDNILQIKSGDYVITDFGISKQLRGTRSSNEADHNGAVAYMGPERFKADYTSIKASDIWSLGATIFEMATGQLPFMGEGGKMQEAGVEMPVLPEQFSKELNSIMQSCLTLETWERPTARYVAEYASDMMKHRPNPGGTVPIIPQPAPQPVAPQPVPQPGTPPVPQPIPQPNNHPTPQPTPQPPKKKLPVIAIVIAAVVVLGVVAYFMLGGKSEAPQNDDVDTVAQSEPVPNPEIIDSVSKVDNTDVDNVEPNKKPVITIINQPVHIADDVPPTPKPSAESSSGTMQLSYGTYTGSIKGGYPHGKGKLVYSTSRQINKYDSKGSMAQAGDYVEGKFDNGFFTIGKHYSADGEFIENINAGYPEGQFELK